MNVQMREVLIDDVNRLISEIDNLSFPEDVNDPGYIEGYCDAISDVTNTISTYCGKRIGCWIITRRIEEVEPLNDIVTDVEIEEKCSRCGRYVYRYEAQPMDGYCPSCGACMTGEIDEFSSTDSDPLRENVQIHENSEYIAKLVKELFKEEGT